MPDGIAPTTLSPLPELVRLAFHDGSTAATRERVRAYLDHFWTDEMMGRSFEWFEQFPAWQVFEQYDPSIPTEAAWFAEVALANGIVKHAAGEIPDADMKALLTAYVDTHIWLYQGGTRDVKRGDLRSWTGENVPLVRVTSPSLKGLDFICTVIGGAVCRMMCVGEVIQIDEV